jgi:phage/plasmid-associated DNA primase
LEGDTEAWRRRLVIIEYKKIKPQTVISDLDRQILKTEGSGVLNWMLQGLDKLKADGWQLNLTPSQQSATDSLLLESDSLAVFARECLRRSPEASLTVADCFIAYVEFCTERGWKALTRNRYGSAMPDEVIRQFGLTVRHDIKDDDDKPQRGWRGLTLVDNPTDPTGKRVSELSENPSEDDPSDTTDTFFPHQWDKS